MSWFVFSTNYLCLIWIKCCQRDLYIRIRTYLFSTFILCFQCIQFELFVFNFNCKISMWITSCHCELFMFISNYAFSLRMCFNMNYVFSNLIICFQCELCVCIWNYMLSMRLMTVYNELCVQRELCVFTRILYFHFESCGGITNQMF